MKRGESCLSKKKTPLFFLFSFFLLLLVDGRFVSLFSSLLALAHIRIFSSSSSFDANNFPRKQTRTHSSNREKKETRHAMLRGALGALGGGGGSPSRPRKGAAAAPEENGNGTSSGNASGGGSGSGRLAAVLDADDDVPTSPAAAAGAGEEDLAASAAG